MNIEIFTSAILSKMSDIGKWQRSFLLDVIRLYSGLQGRVNYLNLGRWGVHNELSYRRNFSKPFNFRDFNLELIRSTCSKDLAILHIRFQIEFLYRDAKQHLGLDIGIDPNQAENKIKIQKLYQLGKIAA